MFMWSLGQSFKEVRLCEVWVQDDIFFDNLVSVGSKSKAASRLYAGRAGRELKRWGRGLLCSSLAESPALAKSRCQVTFCSNHASNLQNGT